MDHMKASYEPGVLSPNSGEVALEVWISKQDSQLKQIAVEETADLGPEGTRLSASWPQARSERTRR